MSPVQCGSSMRSSTKLPPGVGIYNNIATKLHRFIVEFYCSELYSISRAYERGPLFSTAMILSKPLLLLAYCFIQNIEETAIADFNFKYIATLTNIIDDTSATLTTFKHFFLLIHIIIILSLLTSFTIYVKKTKYSVQFDKTKNWQSVSLDDNKEKNRLQKQNNFHQGFSLILALFAYWVYIPCFLISLRGGKAIDSANLILAIIINLIHKDCEYCYDISTNEQMRKPYSLADGVISFTLETILFFAIGLSSGWEIFLSFIYFLACLFLVMIDSPYYERRMQISSQFVLLFSAMCCLAPQVGLQVKLSVFSISFICFVSLPIALKLSLAVTNYQEKKIRQWISSDIFYQLRANKQTSKNQSFSVDRMIRSSVFNEATSCRERERRLVRLIKITLNDNSKSFDSIKLKQQRDSQIEDQQMKKLELEELVFLRIKTLINESMRQKILVKGNDHQSMNSAEFHEIVIYFTFLLQVQICPKLYFMLFTSLTQSKSTTIKQRQVLLSIHRIFLRSRAILRQTFANQSPFDTSFNEVLTFESTLEDLFEQIDITLKLKSQVLQLLKKKFIDSLLLTEGIKEFLRLQKMIRANLSDLAQLNVRNSDLIHLETTFTNFLAFNEKKSNSFRSAEWDFNHRSSIRNSSSKQQIRTDHFSENSCVIFASFEFPDNLTIRRVSQNFSNIFQTPKKNVIDRRIEILMPMFMQKHHSKFIEKFLSMQLGKLTSKEIVEGTKETSLQSGMNKQIIFASITSDSQLVVPVRIDIRVNSLPNSHYFGLTANISKVNEAFDYILFEEQTFAIVGFTPNAQNVFINDLKLLHASKGLHQSSLSLDIREIFPFLFVEEEEDEEEDKKVPRIRKYHPNISEEVIELLDENYNSIKNKQHNLVQMQFLCLLGSPLDISSQSSTQSATFKKRGTDKFDTDLLNSKAAIQLPILFELVTFTLKNLSIDYFSGKPMSYIEILRVQSINPYSQAELILSHLTQPKKAEIYTRLSNCGGESGFQQIIAQLTSIASNRALFEQRELEEVEELDDTDDSCVLEDQQRGESKLKSELGLSKTFNLMSHKNHSPSIIINIQQGLAKRTTRFLGSTISTHRGGLLKQQNPLGSKTNRVFESYSAEAEQSQRQSFAPMSAQIELLGSEGFSETKQIHHAHRLQQKAATMQHLSLPTNQLSLQNYQERQQIANHHETFNFTTIDVGSPRSVVDDHGCLSQAMIIDDTQHHMQFQDNSTDILKLKSSNISLLALAATLPPILSDSTRISTFSVYNKLQVETLIQNNSKEISRDIVTQDNKTGQKILMMEKVVERLPPRRGGGTHSFKDTGNHQLDQLRDEQQADQASTTSHASTTSLLKRQLISLMDSRSTLQIIKIVNLLGLLCYVAMVTIKIFQFTSMRAELWNQHQDFLVFEWPGMYQSALSSISKNKNIVFMTNTYSLVKFSSTNEWNAFRAAATSQALLKFNLLYKLLAQKERASPDRQIFRLIRTQPGDYLQGILFPSILAGSSSNFSQLLQETLKITLSYSIEMTLNYILRFSKNLGFGRAEYYMTNNQLIQLIGLKMVQATILENQQQNINDIVNQLTTLMVVVIITIAICVGVILPLYTYIQKQRGEVLSLFGTFQISTIDQTIAAVENSLISLQEQQGKNKLQKRKAGQQKTFQGLENVKKLRFSQPEDNRRRNTTGTVSQLAKSNAMLTVCVLFIFALISFEPILNRVFTRQYLDISLTDLKTLNQVIQLNSFAVENIGIHYNVITTILYPTFKFMKVADYQDYMKSLVDQADAYNQKLDWLSTQQFTDLRYKQDLYESFFFKVIKENLCQVFITFSSYNFNSTILNNSTCSTLHDGFLTQGLQIAYKKYLTIFSDLYGIYNIADSTTQVKTLISYLDSLNVKNFTEFQESIETAFTSLKNFILDRRNEYYNFIKLFHIAITIFQISLMTIVFVVGWLSFSNYLNCLIHETRAYLKVMGVRQLLENTYILSYIKKNSIM